MLAPDNEIKGCDFFRWLPEISSLRTISRNQTKEKTMWIWIKENTGILTLILVTINVFVGITKFWLLRWQGYERGQDLRDLLFWQEVERRGHGTFEQEKAWKGSKHKWIKRIFKRTFD